ncbi:MAG TPA: malto-oligosyltrehalose trehalohydrolase [Anaeromyxobacteraceae bacterium]|nr:malto-oligosyltrehalose trehalohydrolase [Anaeromyxobacteraceae bacterium]
MSVSAVAWQPTLGSMPGREGTRFRVWAPEVQRVELVLDGGRSLPLERGQDGHHGLTVPGFGAGARYRYRLDGGGPLPDPASRRQPEGVHGPSEVVDPSSFRWTDADWPGIDPEALVVYELHVGTFTPHGTFVAAARRLSALRDLGVTAVELMPVAAFPGRRNWGYDGVAPFAPASVYGAPDDLRALVNAAHGLGMGVLLDVVYNHLGPDGNYLGAFSRFYFDSAIHTPWGAALNFGGAESGPVRAYFLENAAHWLLEYHFDGLRLDATHAIVDRSTPHLLAEIATVAHALSPRRLVMAEDERNLARLVAAPPTGEGLDAVWSDDFHHQVRRRLAGDRDGYFADFDGTSTELAETLRRGWFYVGQLSRRTGKPRGTDPDGIAPYRFVVFLQNHDQVGNRAFGERLHHGLPPEAWRAAVALLLLAPQSPLLFMGQEWSTSTPFLYFTDHQADLGRLVTEGRRRDFAAFEAFRDPARVARIPDPQADATFEASRLLWEEREGPGHAEVVRLHRDLLRLRREALLPRRSRIAPRPAGPDAVVLDAGDLVAAIRFEGEGEVELPASLGPAPRLLLSTEDPSYAADPKPPAMLERGGRSFAAFRRPGALVLAA